MLNDTTNLIILPAVLFAIAVAAILVMAVVAAQRRHSGLVYSHDMKVAAGREPRKLAPALVPTRSVRRAA